MCALVLVLLGLFVIQRRRQGTNTPSLIPGLAVGLGKGGRQGKGGPGGSGRGKALKVLGRAPRSSSFSLDANPSGFAHLIRDSESHSTASPHSQSELPVTGSGLSTQTAAFGAKVSEQTKAHKRAIGRLVFINFVCRPCPTRLLLSPRGNLVLLWWTDIWISRRHCRRCIVDPNTRQSGCHRAMAEGVDVVNGEIIADAASLLSCERVSLTGSTHGSAISNPQMSSWAMSLCQQFPRFCALIQGF